MLGVNMKNVDAAGGNRPGPGGYVIRIMRAINRTDKQYLEIEYDIAEGEFRGYYNDLNRRRGFWSGKFRRSYKESALPFFKAFIEMVQTCNNGAPGLVVGDFEDIDESKLTGCYLGIVYGYEEYIGNDGKVKQRPDHFNAEFLPLDRIRDGEFEIPELKPLDGAPAPTGSGGGVVDTTSGFEAMRDDDIPFYQ